MQEKRFGYDISKLENQHAIFTASEIYQQPDVWLKVCDQLSTQKERIEKFINQALNEKELQIILTGAGTSAFAGEVVEPVLNKTVPHMVRAIATTDIVGNPLSYLSPNKPTLLISYARSGNSPESVAAVELANQLVKNIYHIVITCNEKGALAKMSQTDDKTLLLLMPAETNDKSFAMTSSCTSMILTNLIIFNLENIGRIRTEVELVCQNVRDLFEDTTLIDSILEYEFDRLIILGAGSLKGIAREMSLKILELTAGQVNANYDTPLGFRHGPKSVINDKTLTIVLRQNEQYAVAYDEDLISELRREQKKNRVVVLRNDVQQEGDVSYQERIENPVLLGLQYLVWGQILALKKSLQLKLTPDNPCPTGEVNRVVQGVKIYSF